MAGTQSVIIPIPRKQLLDRGLRAFAGAALKCISMPLGGIGTGCIGLGGRGELRDWEVFNAPNWDFTPDYAVPLIFCRWGRRSVARVLEGRLLPPFTSSRGLPWQRLASMARLAEARFTARYPFGRIDFTDDALPIRVALEAFNPLIPDSPEDSALPVAILTYRLENPTRTRVVGSIAWSMANCVGMSARLAEAGPDQPVGLGQNVNQYRQEERVRGLEFLSLKYQPGQLGYGSMALMSDSPVVTVATGWLERGKSWDPGQQLWNDFAADGRLDGPTTPTPVSEDGRSHVGTLGVPFELAPGGQTQLRFAIAWCFPWRRPPRMRWNPQPTGVLLNHYAGRFPDAWSAGRYALENLAALRTRSEAFEQALFDSTLPGHVLELVSTQLCILKSPTVLWLDVSPDEPEGRIFGYEGCDPAEGCCPMNCTHVWNYAQTLAHLYPSLERTMRRTDYLDNVRDQGAMAFRTTLPLKTGLPAQRPFPAADGQFGTVLRLYRDWQLSGDNQMLRELYPALRDSLDFAQQGYARWDADGDGVLEGLQANTYDIEFHGPNPLCGLLYLAALRAGARMARAMGDEDTANRWEALQRQGASGYDRLLFNGEYYVQRVTENKVQQQNPPGGAITSERPKYQHGSGCLSDQLLGQFMAHLTGLGYVLPQDHVRKALAAIFRHNFKQNLSGHISVQRAYALNDEPGLLMCTWPRGGREAFPFPYSDEVWSGTEHQVAAHLIWEGFIEEGLAIAWAVCYRHDGVRRNPFDQTECGRYYARALSSWALLLALSGQRYSTVERTFWAYPALWPRDFRCLVTLGEAWGRYRQRVLGKRFTAAIELLGGQAMLERLRLRWRGPSSRGNGPPKVDAAAATSTAMPCAQVSVCCNGQQIPAQARRQREWLEVDLEEPMTLRAGQTLELSAR